VKTLGLIGGMSWESTVPYYRLINEGVKARLGGLHSARLLLYSVDFAEVEHLQRVGDWDAAGFLLAQAAQTLQTAGAQGLVLCTNTMHKVAGTIEAAVGVPLLHIADATAQAIVAAGLQRVGLLGTRFTMEQDFYKARLTQRFGLDVLVPGQDDRDQVHRIIYEELCLGQVHAPSRETYRRVMGGLVAQGAQAIILGCTEIGLLVNDKDSAVPLFDTTALHAQAAVDWMLSPRAARERAVQQPGCTPSLRRMISIMHQWVRALCSRLAPTKAVKASHQGLTKIGLPSMPRARDSRMKVPATRRTTCQVFMKVLLEVMKKVQGVVSYCRR
jgi:aspartate racemase